MTADTFKDEKLSVFYRLLTWVMHFVHARTKGMTMGVRAACFDEEGRIFLVRHTYLPGWYLPGGGVERGETVHQALIKELREEGNLVALDHPQLINIYFNRAQSKRDHVSFFRVHVRQTMPRKPDYEIAESGFFALNTLPQGVTAATRRRLAELESHGPYSELW